jgi:hypothetical protein
MTSNFILSLSNVLRNNGETVITSIVNKLLDSIKKERNEGTNPKSNKQTKAIGNLTNENEVLRELIAGETHFHCSVKRLIMTE